MEEKKIKRYGYDSAADDGATIINNLLGNDFSQERTRSLKCPECGEVSDCFTYISVKRESDSSMNLISNISYECRYCGEMFEVDN